MKCNYVPIKFDLQNQAVGWTWPVDSCVLIFASGITKYVCSQFSENFYLTTSF